MRTAILTVAAFASTVLAAPGWDGRGDGSWGGNGQWTKRPQGTGWGSWSSSSSFSSSSSSSTPTSSVASSTTSTSSVVTPPSTATSSPLSVTSSSVLVSPVTHGTSSAPHTVSAPGSLTFSISKNATSSGSTGSAPVKPTTTDYSTTYTTDIVTIWTTVCPVTKTHVTGGSTATSTYLTTSTLTSSYTTTLVSKITSSPEVSPVSSSSPAAPSSTVKTTVTDVTTVYTTVCPATATSVSGSTTLTTTYQTTSTVTSVVKSTVTLTIPVTPVGPSSTVTTSVTDVTSLYTTVVPTTATSVTGGTTFTTTYKTTSTVTSVVKSTITLTVPVTVATTPASPATTTPEVPTVTDVTTIYTTICPATTVLTSGSSTWTSTFQSTSTVTSVSRSTITTTISEVSTVQWGTTILTYTVTQEMTFPTSTPTTFVGPSSYSKVSTSSVSGKPKPSGSVSTKKTRASGSVTKTKSTAATGSVSSKSVVSSSTASSTKPAVTGTGSSTKPAVTGTGSSTKPAVTGTSSSSTSSATSSSWPSETCIPCEGQPGNDPNTWCGLTINDNSYKVMPKTCRTVEYDFVVTNTTFAPDGVPRLGLLVNGQMPGPTIEANWGDTIIVRVHNQLQDNGTAIHFHGQRQNYTNEMDGVPSITQCPLAPGSVQTYKFKADNYGSSWWHSHYSLQIYDGLFGPMIIHGPASASYDAEQFITLQDWNHVPLEVLYDASQTVGNAPGNGPQALDTGLINGKNVFGSSGSRFNMEVESGKTYRLRLLNSAVQTTFKFFLDGHTFQVIANDYVPITPYTTTIVNINPGQRYDVIFKADQPVGNYWLRADAQQTCTTLKNAKDIKAVVSYKGAASGTPTSTAYTYVEECVDEPLASLVPVKTISAGAQDQNLHETVLIGGNGGTPNLYKWTLSGSTFQSQYGDPSLVSIYNNGSTPNYSGNLAIQVPTLHEWVYVIIESPIPVPHPIHLHGHDFLILAQGYGSYSSSVVLNTASPARRDSALMPGNRGQGGYLVVAFEADNPGAWLMHCHIGWHSAMGFALQIIENLDGISETVKHGDDMNEICTDWSAYATANDITVEDSGI